MKVEVVELERVHVSDADTNADTETMLKNMMKMEMMELTDREEEEVVVDIIHVEGNLFRNALCGISVPLVHARIGIYVRKDI